MPLPTAPKPWSFYRLGPTKEKVLFKRHHGTYDGVVVPAHIASYYSKFCSEFIGALRKSYLIDPMTYLFAGSPTNLRRFLKDRNGRTLRDVQGRKRKGDVRRSYSKLVHVEYQGVVEHAVDRRRALAPSDFADRKVADAFVKRVVAFQRDRLASVPDKYRKYAKFAERAGKPLILDNPPAVIVAPYFPTTTLDARGWHHTNVQMIRRTKAEVAGIPVFAVILADTLLLAQHAQQIAADYSEAGADGFLLWPDGFSGDKDPAALPVVFNAVRALSAESRPVILMYGDAFSLALHYVGLTGFSSGICYGESKRSAADIDMEGEIPPRYYLSRLKKKMVIETTVRRIQFGNYPELVCQCQACQGKPPATLDDGESKEHFMLVRAAELAQLRSRLSRQEFAAELRAAYEQYRDDPLLRPVGHLADWAMLLSQ